ncbi:MAG TPA: carboxypeptidase-like regulatory domain-containing protein, partial [Planctomycetota bacterium]|nr:carboxypeptidase-like regulatory domain-containing protein [Planctomycetota bacterium]
MTDGGTRRLAWILVPSAVAVLVAAVLLILDMNRRAAEPPTVTARRETLNTVPPLERLAPEGPAEPEQPAQQKSQEELDQEKIPTVPLSGTVVDTFGAPVAGAEIQPVRTWEYAVDPTAAVTSEDGRFDVTVLSRLDHSVPSSTTHSRSTDPLTGLVVRHKDYVPQYVPLRGPHEEFTVTEGLEIVLEQGGTIEGIVRDEAGNPLPQFEVGPLAEYVVTPGWTGEVKPIGPHLFRWNSATTDRYGRYVLAGFPEGRYRAESRVEGYEGKSGLVRLGPKEVARDVNVTVRVVRRDGVIAGTILDEDHAAVVGLKVQIRGNDADLWVTTKAEGQYRAEGLLVEAEYSVTPWLHRLRDDWGKTGVGGLPKQRDYVAMPYRPCSQTVRPDAEHVDFVLEPFHPAEPGSFTVHVSRHSDGAPVREFTLSYAGKNVECKSDDGSYSESNVPPGTYTITIDAAGFPKFETAPFEI